MPTIHFSWCISPTPRMISNSLYLATTARELGPCTVWVWEKELDQVDPRLRKLVDVRPYREMDGMKFPWYRTPKWLVEPQGDIILGCGADILIWNPDKLIQAAEQCLAQDAIAGTIAYLDPLTRPEWEKLLNDYELPLEFRHRYQVSQNPAPFYINHAAVLMPTSIFYKFKEAFYKYLAEIYARMPENYFMCQVALTIAIAKIRINRIEMSRLFNYSEICHPGMPDIDQATIVHYENTRNGPGKDSSEALLERLKRIEAQIQHTCRYL